MRSTTFEGLAERIFRESCEIITREAAGRIIRLCMEHGIQDQADRAAQVRLDKAKALRDRTAQFYCDAMNDPELPAAVRDKATTGLQEVRSEPMSRWLSYVDNEGVI